MTRRRRLRSTNFASEAALCEAFTDRARECGWMIYPEVGGWDIVLAANREDGSLMTIGIQAKLRRSWQLLAQATDRRSNRGPDFRAILVPDLGDDGYRGLLTDLRLVGYSATNLWNGIDEPSESVRWDGFDPLVLPVISGVGRPGTPSPIRLTPWREKAIVLCGRLRAAGALSGHDFERLGCGRATWIRAGWLRAANASDGGGRWEFVDGSRRQMYLQNCPDDELPDARYSEDIRRRVIAAMG